MFHRVKSETPQTSDTQVPNQQQNHATPPQGQQQARPVERMAPPPANTAQPAIQSQQAKTQETFYQKEAQTMTDTAQPKKTETQTQDAARALDIPGGNAFQRQGQQPGWNAGNYPGSGYVAGGLHSPGLGVQGSDNKLTIGRGITMSGEIKSCNHLVVEGTVEASLTGASVLEIAQSGTFFGTVEIEEATVAGNFEGDITVSGRLLVRSTGTIKGTISYKELEVEAGAVLEGRISPTSSAGQTAGGRRSGGANKQNKPSATSAQKEAANNEQGLFGGTSAAAE
ncbi:MAG: polymer-forming cytoskeletal protein [Alphaproteobacteria bacterium]